MTVCTASCGSNSTQRSNSRGQYDSYLRQSGSHSRYKAASSPIEAVFRNSEKAARRWSSPGNWNTSFAVRCAGKETGGGSLIASEEGDNPDGAAGAEADFA